MRRKMDIQAEEKQMDNRDTIKYRKWKIGIVCVFLLAAFCGCAPSPSSEVKNTEEEGKRISLIAIITNPEKYDGVCVAVHGALKTEDDGVALYMFAEDADYTGHISAVWLGKYSEIEKFTEEQLKALDGKCVGVTGTVAAKKYGPTRDYNCEMTEIEEITEMKEVRETKNERLLKGSDEEKTQGNEK